VNTITFIENGKRFISSSDDKKIFVWDFGIPIVIKHMSEPVNNLLRICMLSLMLKCTQVRIILPHNLLIILLKFMKPKYLD
jgi:WD40 repeat protein